MDVYESTFKGDHPRSRGVYRKTSSSLPITCGSSPLARGLPRSLEQLSCAGGIIPARAGFTGGAAASALMGGDHPRSRGVYANLPYKELRNNGSSPLARGLLVKKSTAKRISGIIPARAGFTEDVLHSISFRQDHPRSRGVYSRYAEYAVDNEGSSPLARGLLIYRPFQEGGRGIIPARAGFTAPRTLHRKLPQDHPRSRGVYGRGTSVIRSADGSSPLARGLRMCRREFP